MFGSYSKFISSIVTAAIAWATIVVQSAPAAIYGSEWLAGGTLLAGAFGVYQLGGKATA